MKRGRGCCFPLLVCVYGRTGEWIYESLIVNGIRVGYSSLELV